MNTPFFKSVFKTILFSVGLCLASTGFAQKNSNQNALEKPLRVLKQSTLSGQYTVSQISEKKYAGKEYFLVELRPSSSPNGQTNKQKNKQKKKLLQIELTESPKDLQVGDKLAIKAEIQKEKKNIIRLAQFAFLLQEEGESPKLVRYLSRHAKDLTPVKPSYLRLHSPSSDYIIF